MEPIRGWECDVSRRPKSYSQNGSTVINLPGWRCSWISWVAVAVCCWVAWEVLDPCQLGTQLPRSQGAKDESKWVGVIFCAWTGTYWIYTGYILELWFDGLCGALWYFRQSFTSALQPCFSEVLVLSNSFGHASGPCTHSFGVITKRMADSWLKHPILDIDFNDKT